MRISDWSSDVCSSDLLLEHEQLHPALHRVEQLALLSGVEGAVEIRGAGREEEQPMLRGIERLGFQVLQRFLAGVVLRRRAAPRRHTLVGNRKSVVKGQSESGRLGLGDRRSITK